MASVHDVAQYILNKRGELSAMKLQKLCYYSHAWHLVWEERPLFSEEIQAWANGPVVRALYAAHRGQFRVSTMPEYTNANPEALSGDEISSIEAVLDFYGDLTAHQLSELTHSERPWQAAREGLPAGARSEKVISDIDMAAFYDSLTEDADQS